MKILVFGGTTEGRKLAAALSGAGIEALLSVATEYGKGAAKSVEVTANRLGEKEMADLLKDGGFDCAVDATHPYAAMATENIKNACETAGVKYYRLKRPESDPVSGVIYTEDAESAAGILKDSEGIVLLTTGSKDLEPFTRVPDYEDRFFVRILPMPDSLNKALELGFRGSNIICMQGPFGFEINLAILKMTGAKYLVTKESGEAGGFKEKVSAALSAGCKVIVIGRPAEEEGYTLEEISRLFGIEEPRDAAKPKTLFPVFMDLKGKDVLILGGGRVAERRIKTLSDFGARITVVSPEVTESIRIAVTDNRIKWLKKEYQNGDITGLRPLLVIAATNDRQANRGAMEEAMSLGIPVSVADRSEECTFWFPAIAESAGFICGIVSKDGDHSAVKEKAAEIRRILEK